MEKMTIVLATNNRHKVEEMSQILAGLPVVLRTAAEFPGLGDIEEDGDTYEANALKKARHVFRHTGLSSLADDSGLEVDALGGEPGIFSARYGGVPHDHPRNIRKLLANLKNVPFEKRTARFHSVIAYIDSQGIEHCFHGLVEGFIIDELRGSNGFGYDPVFWIQELQMTVAQLDPDTKNRISHRGRALEKFKSFVLSEATS
jgi:XTP/dITP diphosphohydrolase